MVVRIQITQAQTRYLSITLPMAMMMNKTGLEIEESVPYSSSEALEQNQKQEKESVPFFPR